MTNQQPQKNKIATLKATASAPNQKRIDDVYIEGELFHYTVCGLDNIYLTSGFRISDDGLSYAIDDLEGLYACIARSLVKFTRRLSGPESRFLRKQIGLTQSALAQLAGVDAQTVARWEKEAASNVPADRLLRGLYIEHDKLVDKTLTDLLYGISDMDVAEHSRWMFEQTEEWHKRAA